MPKGSYIPWTSSEENNLEQWISEHLWMSWERRAEEYSKQHNKGRSFESLRGKYNQLRKGIRRRRPISDRMPTRTRTMTRRARYRRQKLPEGFLLAPLSTSLRPRALGLVDYYSKGSNSETHALEPQWPRRKKMTTRPHIQHIILPRSILAPNRSFGGVNNQPLFHSFGG